MNATGIRWRCLPSRGPWPRRDGAPAQGNARGSSPAASVRALCADEGRGTPSPRGWEPIPLWGATRSGRGGQAGIASPARFVLSSVPTGLRVERCGSLHLPVVALCTLTPQRWAGRIGLSPAKSGHFLYWSPVHPNSTSPSRPPQVEPPCGCFVSVNSPSAGITCRALSSGPDAPARHWARVSWNEESVQHEGRSLPVLTYIHLGMPGETLHTSSASILLVQDAASYFNGGIYNLKNSLFPSSLKRVSQNCTLRSEKENAV